MRRQRQRQRAASSRPRTPADRNDAERMARIVAQYPLRRLGRPEDVVPTILLLASPLSGWTTGQVLSVNGGYAMP